MPIKRSDQQPAHEEPECVEQLDTTATIIDFLTRDGRVHGFPFSQLMNYLLDANPDLQRNREAPPERLTFWFSTHDVAVLGWRLQNLRPLLRSAKIAALCAIESRYTNVAPRSPFIAEIVVTPVKSTLREEN